MHAPTNRRSISQLLKLSLAIAAVFALCACGSTEPTGAGASPCSRYDELVNNGGLLAKVSDCPYYAAWLQQAVGAVDLTSCNVASTKCTAADKDVIGKRLDCLAQLPNCVAGKEWEWSRAWSACDSTEEITDACLDAVEPLAD